MDLDSLGFFDFATGLGDQEDIPVVENEDELSDIERLGQTLFLLSLSLVFKIKKKKNYIFFLKNEILISK